MLGKLLVAAGVAALGVGCSTSPSPTVASIGLSASSLTLVVGSETSVLATPRDADGVALSGITISWSSADTAIATVSAAGMVMGVAPGNTTVTATSAGVSASLPVTVTPSDTSSTTVAR